MSTVDEAGAAHRSTSSSTRARSRRVRAVGVVVLGLTIAACSDSENIGLINDSDEVVTVEFASGESEELPAGGGAFILDVGECFDGQILVSYESGSAIDVPGPICPGEELRITAADAEIGTTQAP
jgi:hypothetical protein